MAGNSWHAIAGHGWTAGKSRQATHLGKNQKKIEGAPNYVRKIFSSKNFTEHGIGIPTPYACNNGKAKMAWHS